MAGEETVPFYEDLGLSPGMKGGIQMDKSRMSVMVMDCFIQDHHHPYEE